jgi:hypothetical protein
MKNSTSFSRCIFFTGFLLLVFPCSFAQLSITGFNPLTAPAGATVTITGTGFSPTASANIVKFGPLRATVTSATTSQLVVTAPSGASYAKISVSTNGLIAESPRAFFTSIPLNRPLNNSSFEYAYPAYCNPCFNFWAENGVALEADDIDGDGKTNLLAVTNLGSLSVYNFDDPNGPFTVFYPILSGVASTLVLADIDGDGLKDVASAGKVYRNTSTPGSISFAEPSATGFSISWTSLAYADFNRDGKLDLVAADDTNNMVEFYENNSSVGNISFTNGFQRAITNPTSVASSDINSDGFPEVIVASRSTNRIGVLGNKAVTGPILTGSMDPTFTLLVTGAGSLPTKIAVGDLASDGFPEIVAILSGTSKYMVFRNTASTSPVTTASFQGGVPYALETTCSLLKNNDNYLLN